MNTANLQLEGLYAALTALIDVLKAKGVLDEDEVDRAFRQAEQRIEQDPDRSRDISDANVNAILFPLRLLRLANEDPSGPQSFTELAARIGRTKAD